MKLNKDLLYWSDSWSLSALDFTSCGHGKENFHIINLYKYNSLNQSYLVTIQCLDYILSWLLQYILLYLTVFTVWLLAPSSRVVLIAGIQYPVAIFITNGALVMSRTSAHYGHPRKSPLNSSNFMIGVHSHCHCEWACRTAELWPHQHAFPWLCIHLCIFFICIIQS